MKFFKALYSRLKASAIFVAFSLYIVIALWYGLPLAEKLYYPVLVDFKITSQQLVDNKLNVVFSYIKRRDCEAIGISAFLTDNPDKDLTRTIIANTNRQISPSGAYQRPLDTAITSNPYTVILFSTPEFKYLNKYLYIRFSYSCVPLWVTNQMIGPFKILDKEESPK